MRNDNPKFYLSSFGNVITMQMNPAMAIELFIEIQSRKEVGKELYAATEKIRTQLFHMKKTQELEDAIAQRKSVARNSTEDSRQSNAGASQNAPVQEGDELVDVGGSVEAAA